MKLKLNLIAEVGTGRRRLGFKQRHIKLFPPTGESVSQDHLISNSFSQIVSGHLKNIGKNIAAVLFKAH